MFLKMLAAFTGGFNCNVGDIRERPDDEAVRLIKAGFARKATRAEADGYLAEIKEAERTRAEAQAEADAIEAEIAAAAEAKAEADRLAAEEATKTAPPATE